MAPDLVFVDLETSGLDERIHEILEIAAIRVDATTGEPTMLVERVKPILPVDPEAAAINGYERELWRDAITLEEALLRVFPLLDGARWVGSNPSFDFRFVSAAARACGLDMPALASRRLVDVSAMAEPLVAAGLIAGTGLEALREYFGIQAGAAHRARNDALATFSVYRSLLALYQPAIDRRRVA